MKEGNKMTIDKLIEELIKLKEIKRLTDNVTFVSKFEDPKEVYSVQIWDNKPCLVDYESCFGSENPEVSIKKRIDYFSNKLEESKKSMEEWKIIKEESNKGVL
jgi:hypothetical protein